MTTLWLSFVHDTSNSIPSAQFFLAKKNHSREFSAVTVGDHL
jgi:hypothetical protein